MGRRYYCEFCEKAFADNMSSRRNHLRSVHHQRMRKQHYDAFRDPATILAEEMAKPSCKKFFRSGSCDFGSNCCFSHLTPERKQELDNLIQHEKEKRKAGKSEEIPSLEKWLAKRSKKDNPENTNPIVSGQELPVYTLPQCLVGIPDLPMSLLPPPPEAFKPGVNNEEWG